MGHEEGIILPFLSVLKSCKNFSLMKIIVLLRAKIIKKQKQLTIMLNQYETVFIATPVLSENQMKEAVQKFKKVITENEGEIVHEENWGLKKLAYPIQKKSTGFYYLIEFRGTGDLIEKLEVQYRRDERIIRFLTFRMEKHAVEYAEKKRRQKESGKTKEE
jgi:small subunit ribosomal protein S6